MKVADQDKICSIVKILQGAEELREDGCKQGFASESALQWQFTLC